jgi:hypothetical protein
LYNKLERLPLSNLIFLQVRLKPIGAYIKYIKPDNIGMLSGFSFIFIVIV